MDFKSFLVAVFCLSSVIPSAFGGTLTLKSPTKEYSAGQWEQSEFLSPNRYWGPKSKLEAALLLGGNGHPVACMITQSVAAEKGLTLSELEEKAQQPNFTITCEIPYELPSFGSVTAKSISVKALNK